MEYEQVLERLRSLANSENVAGMARFGIDTKNAYGISIYDLRPLGKEIGKDHVLAQRLWESGIHEGRLLAGYVDSPEWVTEDQMESWVADFDSWDVCDQVCSSLFDATRFAYKKAIEWSERTEEFVKRSGFVMMAALSVHDKAAGDAQLAQFLPIIKRESTDGRNFVKKAINWALRQIGKRNLALNALAIEAAREIQKIDSKAARWIAADALRELTGDAVQARLRSPKAK